MIPQYHNWRVTEHNAEWDSFLYINNLQSQQAGNLINNDA